MKVQVAVYNEGQRDQYYGLVRVEKNNGIIKRYPLHCLRRWKTAKGAENHAKKHGYEMVTFW